MADKITKVTPIENGGTGATSAWAAKTNLEVPLVVNRFIGYKTGTTLSVPAGRIFYIFGDGGLHQLLCTNSGYCNWRTMVQGLQQLTVDVSIANRVTITMPSYDASFFWLNFDNNKLQVQ